LFTVALFPLGFLTWSSLTLNAGDYSIGNLGLHYWIGRSNPRFAAGEPGILRNEAVLGAVWNSVRLSIIGGLLCGFLGMLIGYVVARARKSLASRLLEQISFVPMLVPSIVFGALYLTLFAVRRGPVPALYGTFALLVLVTVVKQLPYTVRSGVSSMLQVSAELEEAAVILGAPWMQRLRKIMLPLTRSGFVAGSLIVLITSMRELSLYILLVTPANRVLTTLTYRYVEVGYTQFSNAMTVLLTVLVVVLTYAINAWQKTDLAAGLGGR
jgi:iron(III) transport system permease protein